MSPFVSPSPFKRRCRAKALRNHNPRVGGSSPSSGITAHGQIRAAEPKTRGFAQRRSDPSEPPTSVLAGSRPVPPARNAYLLQRDTVYFDGHGIGQPLTVLLAYTVVAGALLFVFDWFIDKPSLSVPGINEEPDTTPVLAPVGPPP